MQINPAFPPSRLDMPKRRAERQIYQSLADSAVPGRALYEVKVTPAATQVDFLVWAEGVAAYSVQVKGGRYLIHEGEFCLVTDRGRTPQPGLPAQVWDSAMAVPDHLERRLGHRLFIIPVLALPDMEQDKDIQDLAARRSVMTLFGVTGWSIWPAARPSGTGPPRPASRRRRRPLCRNCACPNCHSPAGSDPERRAPPYPRRAGCHRGSEPPDGQQLNQSQGELRIWRKSSAAPDHLQVQVEELHRARLSQSSSPRKYRFHLGFSLGGAIRRPGRQSAEGDQLRRGEAPGAVPAGRQAAPAGPGAVSPRAAGAGERHLRRGGRHEQ